MYNNAMIEKLICTIEENAGIGNKEVLAAIIEKEFSLQRKRAVYYGDYFAIRFSSTKSKSESVSNTVMALKHIRNFDDVPVLVCVVGPEQNYIRLANATFIKKVSHSSKNLRVDNIVGNINYSDILRLYNGIPNHPDNFERLFKEHRRIGFSGNLLRIVAETGNIVPTGQEFTPTEKQKQIILNAPQRTYDFMMSAAYHELKRELDEKANSAKADIILIEKAYSHDVKLRGNLIEHFIKSEDEKQKEELRKKLKRNEVIEDIFVDNDLGDYSVEKDGFLIETDIKSKINMLNSAPKGYNVDKLLGFLSSPSSVYLLYIVSINKDEELKTELASIFQKQILEKTRIQHHWSGRNSRGTAQFDGRSLEYFIEDASVHIDFQDAKRFLERLLEIE